MKFKLLSTFIILFISLSVQAGATRQDDGNQALKRMQFMLKQLTNEKAELEIEKDKLDEQVEELEKKLSKVEQLNEEKELSIHRMEGNINSLNGTIEKREAKIAKREKQLREVIGKYQDAQLLIRQLNSEKADLEQVVFEKEEIIEDYNQKNKNMYDLNLELMDLYENKGRFESVLQSEGITGLKQVEIENILQEYKFKVEDNLTNLDTSN